MRFGHFKHFLATLKSKQFLNLAMLQKHLTIFLQLKFTSTKLKQDHANAFAVVAIRTAKIIPEKKKQEKQGNQYKIFMQR